MTALSAPALSAFAPSPAAAAWGWAEARRRDAARDANAVRLLVELAAGCRSAARGAGPFTRELGALDPEVRARMLAVLGLGGVSWRLNGHVAATETAFPGVWRVRLDGRERIEIGAAPESALDGAHAATRPAAGRAARPDARLALSPALLDRAFEAAARWRPGESPQRIEIARAALGAEDRAHLDRAFGLGSAEARIGGRAGAAAVATALPRIWRVSQNTAHGAPARLVIEIADIPFAAAARSCAIAESARELTELAESLG